VAMVLALWMARGAMAVLHGVQGWARFGLRRQLVTVTGVLLLAALPLASVLTRFQAMDLSADYRAYLFADDVLKAAAPDAIMISSGDAQTFPLWYLRYGLGKRADVIVVDRNLLAFDWYRDDLAWQHPELAMVSRAQDAEEAATILVLEGRRRPIHLTYSDDFLLRLAPWTQEGILFTLLRK